MPLLSDIIANPSNYISFITSKNFESQWFERKEVVQEVSLKNLNESILKTASGFANSNREGGIIVLGVTDSGDISGIKKIPEQRRNEILQKLNQLNNLVWNTINLPCRNVDDEEDFIYLLHITYTENAICETSEAFPRAWKRAGAQNLPLKPRELDRLKRNKKIIKFEESVCAEYHAEDVDPQIYGEFNKKYLQNRDAKESYSMKKLLAIIGAITKEGGTFYFTNSGFLFFGKYPRSKLACSYVRVLKYECNLADIETQLVHPIFDKEFEGSLIHIIRELTKFLRLTPFFKTLYKRGKLHGIMQQTEYPLIAVGEAIINALIHRDYGETSGIMCSAFNDAFVVKSPGDIPQNAPKQFTIDTVSLASVERNPKLAEWTRHIADENQDLFARGLSEGTKKMVKEMQKFGLPAPEYKNMQSTSVIFYNKFDERKEQYSFKKIEKIKQLPEKQIPIEKQRKKSDGKNLDAKTSVQNNESRISSLKTNMDEHSTLNKEKMAILQGKQDSKTSKQRNNQINTLKVEKDKLITVEGLITAIEEIELIHQKREITLEELADHLKCNEELAKHTLYQAIKQRRVNIKYKNNNSPKHIKKHSFELDDNWNLKSIVKLD